MIIILLIVNIYLYSIFIGNLILLLSVFSLFSVCNYMERGGCHYIHLTLVCDWVNVFIERA